MSDNLYPYFATAGGASGPVLATKEVSAGVHILKVTAVDQAGLAGSAVQGNVASGATDAGNPVKVGAVFLTTTPTVTNGQRVDAQANNHGYQLVAAALNGGALVAGGDAVSNTSRMSFIDQTSAAGTALGGYLPTFGWAFNGSTWDRIRNAVANGGLQVEEGPFTIGRATADQQIKGSAGFIHSITVAPSAATPAAGVLTIYDSTTEGGTVLLAIALPAAVFAPFTILMDARTTTGIFVGYDASLTNTNVAVSFR